MLCFRKILVAKKFIDKREGQVSRFPSKIFCLTVPKNAVGEPFSLSSISGIEKVWMRGWGGGGGMSRFSVENFLSHSAEKFRKATLQGVTNFGYRKILCFRGLCHDFLSSIFVSQCIKIS